MIISHFIDNPSQNEVYRAQTHVANMIEQIDDDQSDNKVVLNQTQIYLDKLYELIEQQNNAKKLEEQAELLKYLDDSIQEGIKNMTVSTPQQATKNQPALSTDFKLIPPRYTGTIKKTQSHDIIPETFQQLNLEQGLGYLEDETEFINTEAYRDNTSTTSEKEL